MAEGLTAFLSDSVSRRTVQAAVHGAATKRGTVRTAAQWCLTQPSADIMLVDLDGEQNPMAHMAELLRVCRPETVVLATGSENNVTLANDLYRGGVFLYFPKPLDPGSIERAIAEVGARQGDEDPRPEIQASRLVLVVGKGMGANTVTTLLARQAEEHGQYVSCLDLDASFGTMSLALDVEPERGLAQALEHPTAGLSVERLQTRVSPRISLVAHPIDQAGDTPAHHGLLDLIDGLSAHAHVILATGASIADVETLRHRTTSHLIVFEPTPAGLSIAARWLSILDGAVSALVVNRARPLPELLRPDQYRDSLSGRMPDAELPYIRTMAQAMALGEPERAMTRRERQALETILGPLLGIGFT